jgi:hypothetical protein
MLFCLPCRHHARDGDLFRRESTKVNLRASWEHTEYFLPVPVGERTDEVSIQRYGQPWLGCLRRAPWQWGRKPARWSPFTGGFSHEYLSVALVGGVLGDGRLPWGHDREAPHQRAIPVVVSEGPSAGGGVSSSTVDPGVPLGPGLGATWVVFHGRHVTIATARTNATAIAANLRKLPSQS